MQADLPTRASQMPHIGWIWIRFMLEDYSLCQVNFMVLCSAFWWLYLCFNALPCYCACIPTLMILSLVQLPIPAIMLLSLHLCFCSCLDASIPDVILLPCFDTSTYAAMLLSLQSCSSTFFDISLLAVAVLLSLAWCSYSSWMFLFLLSCFPQIPCINSCIDAFIPALMFLSLN